MTTDQAELNMPRYTLRHVAEVTGTPPGTLAQQVQRGLLVPTVPSRDPHRPHMYSAIEILHAVFAAKLSEIGMPPKVARQAIAGMFGAVDGSHISSRLPGRLTMPGVRSWLVVWRSAGQWRLSDTLKSHLEETLATKDADVFLVLAERAIVDDTLAKLQEIRRADS